MSPATKQVRDEATKAMRRTVRGVVMLYPLPQHIDQAVRVLEASSVFLSRAELVDLAGEVAAEFCGEP